jgi:hypothetical protein
VLEGRQSFATEFSGVGTVRLVPIIADTHFKEYNVYFRTIRWWLAAPDPMGNMRAGNFSWLSFRGWALPAQLILLLKRTLGNVIYILEPSDRG